VLRRHPSDGIDYWSEASFMDHFPVKLDQRNRSNESKSAWSRQCTQLAARTVRLALAGGMLVAPASLITTTSCNTCGTSCDRRSVSVFCEEQPLSNCETLSFCKIGVGCHCPTLSVDGKEPTNCNWAACNVTTNERDCATKPGCEWGDACLDTTDCHRMDDNEGACRNNGRCTWNKDCG
jgi:hypothetical protein